MYAFCQDLPVDDVHAHMWLNLSAARAAQIAGAQKLIRDAPRLRKMSAAQMPHIM